VPDDRTASEPEFSILIGLVSTVDQTRVFEVLDALRRQQLEHPHEVVIADRRNDSISDEIGRRHPEVTLVRADPTATLPELRTLALRRSRAQRVVVTEDHCVPDSHWLGAIHAAFHDAAEGTVAVGGCVLNGMEGALLDWSTFLCEYGGFLPPLKEGTVSVLPGMNVCYQRSTIESFSDSELTRGFWETTIHPRLIADGARFAASAAIRVRHCKPFSLRHFSSQRYLYSRYYGGTHPVPRLVAVLTAPLLPGWLLVRQAAQVMGKRGYRLRYLASLPHLTFFHVLSAWGELVGRLCGPGDALRRLE